MTDPATRAEIDEYDFDMPKELIAQHPVANREDARLMVVSRERQAIEHHHVRDLDEILHRHDCLVLNDTKVIPAKLVGAKKKTGGRWTGLFLNADEDNNWQVLCKTRGRPQSGDVVQLEDRQGKRAMELVMVARMEDGSWIVRPDSDQTVDQILQSVGRVPLPHYIRGGNMVDADLDNYQTIYARNAGAVAAPTAGLHLTKPLLRRLIDRGINITRVTLHVGIGTFRPVATDKLADHKMHAEWGEISAGAIEMIEQSKAKGGRVIAVGTTSVRVLETAADRDGKLREWSGETDIFIRPPYSFKTVDALLTNFHRPESTLIVLVRAFGGDRLMKRAYEEAVKQRYRFFSYGDAMLIE